MQSRTNWQRSQALFDMYAFLIYNFDYIVKVRQLLRMGATSFVAPVLDTQIKFEREFFSNSGESNTPKVTKSLRSLISVSKERKCSSSTACSLGDTSTVNLHNSTIFQSGHALVQNIGQKDGGQVDFRQINGQSIDMETFLSSDIAHPENFGIRKTISKAKRSLKRGFADIKSTLGRSKQKTSLKIKSQKCKKPRASNIPQTFYKKMFEFIVGNSPNKKITYSKMKTRFSKLLNQPSKSITQRILNNQELLVWDLLPLYLEGKLHTSKCHQIVKVPHTSDLRKIDTLLLNTFKLDLNQKRPWSLGTNNTIQRSNLLLNSIQWDIFISKLYPDLNSYLEHCAKTLKSFRSLPLSEVNEQILKKGKEWIATCEKKNTLIEEALVNASIEYKLKSQSDTESVNHLSDSRRKIIIKLQGEIMAEKFFNCSSSQPLKVKNQPQSTVNKLQPVVNTDPQAQANQDMQEESFLFPQDDQDEQEDLVSLSGSTLTETLKSSSQNEIDPFEFPTKIREFDYALEHTATSSFEKEEHINMGIELTPYPILRENMGLGRSLNQDECIQFSI